MNISLIIAGGSGNRMHQDIPKLLNLGWKGIFSADRGFAHTISILKEII